MEYLTVSTDMLRSIKPLDEAEKGRLLMAMLTYAENGRREPNEYLFGNERFIWPTAKLYMERGRERYAEQDS